MPVYEYFCQKCNTKFELLRPLSRADEKALCDCCHSEGKRVVSTFAALSRGSDGGLVPAGGGGSCGGCTSTGCATCR
ncbi:MAG: zinc ribbon domain-containing protein [Dehalococcoidia bacterium]|nr:zinc ribbon domain-containing protein [Dehalococcoidia bacterium]MDZ4246845.1 zinc ribbon domain-containing protein [Dehalococcoidia bacterium]